MAEKSEMSMSVQSAWEDLVVENPNRRKLEGCLLTTIMIVVVCIIALLIFVVVQLQPAGNLKKAVPLIFTDYCDNGTCREFSYRAMGWVNWGVLPCENFHKWACHGRATDAPEKVFMHSGDDGAMFAATESLRKAILQRNLFEDKRPPDEKLSGFKYLYEFSKMCVSGLPEGVGLLDLLKANLFSKSSGGPSGEYINGFIFDPDAKKTSAHVANIIRFFYFFPFGKMEIRKSQLNMFPMHQSASVDAFGLPGFKKECATAFYSISVAYNLGNKDSGATVCGFELELIKALGSSNPGVELGEGPTVVPMTLTKGGVFNIDNITRIVYGDVYPTVRFHHPKGAEMISILGKTVKAEAANLATFKLLMHLALFVDDKMEGLGPFLKFAHAFHYGAEGRLSRVHRCGHFLENIFQPMMQAVIQTNINMSEELDTLVKKVTATLTTTVNTQDKKSLFLGILERKISAKGKMVGAIGESLKKLNWFYSMTPKTPFEVSNTIYADLQAAAYDDVKAGSPHDMAGVITANLERVINATIKADKDGSFSWRGPFLRGAPVYDDIEDKIYLPFGLSKAPFNHNHATGISLVNHYAPPLFWKIYQVILRRVITLGYVKAASQAAQAAGLMVPNEADMKHVRPMHACFVKKMNSRTKNTTGAMDLFISTSAISVTYLTWRDVLNHGSKQKDMQLRLKLLPFLSEEKLFFLAAAQAECEAASHRNEIKMRGGPSPEQKVNVPLASELFKVAFGCNKARHMRKLGEGACGTIFKPLKHTTERIHLKPYHSK